MGVERHVRLLRDGESQAQSVNIPVDLELPGEEAVIRKEGDRLILRANSGEEKIEPFRVAGDA